MSAVLDSTVLIDHLRGRAPARLYLAGLTRPTCCEVTRVEVLRGLRSAERSAAESLFRLISWRAVDEAVARLAGRFGRTYRHSHALGVPDLLVAATAEVTGLPLATHNVRHFPMFDGLAPPY